MTCFTQGDDLKSRAVLFYFFDTKEEIAKKASILSTLEIYLEENDDDGLCQYLKMLVSDLTDDLTDEAIEDIYSQFLNSDDSENFKNSGTDDTRISVLKEGVTNGAHTVFRVLNEVGTDYFKGVLRSVPFLKDTSIIVTSFYLTSESIGSIKQWYYGEITGQRCLKNILDSAITLGGSISGGAAGGAIGSFGGPVGFAIGAVAGSIGGSYLSKRLSEYLTEWIFNLPPTVALENAYSFLGIEKNASNNEVNRAFRRLAKRFHPDVPGGSHEMFSRLEIAKEVIKAARE